MCPSRDRGTYLEKGVEDDLRNAALVDVAALEKDLGCSLAYPTGDEQRAPSSAALLRQRSLDANAQIGGGRVALVQACEGL